jgi:hypothetical protein
MHGITRDRFALYTVTRRYLRDWYRSVSLGISSTLGQIAMRRHRFPLRMGIDGTVPTALCDKEVRYAGIFFYKEWFFSNFRNEQREEIKLQRDKLF